MTEMEKIVAHLKDARECINRRKTEIENSKADRKGEPIELYYDGILHGLWFATLIIDTATKYDIINFERDEKRKKGEITDEEADNT